MPPCLGCPGPSLRSPPSARNSMFHILNQVHGCSAMQEAMLDSLQPCNQQRLKAAFATPAINEKNILPEDYQLTESLN